MSWNHLRLITPVDISHPPLLITITEINQVTSSVNQLHYYDFRKARYDVINAHLEQIEQINWQF